MAKSLRGKKNRKNWKKGLKLKQASIGINDTRQRKGQIFT